MICKPPPPVVTPAPPAPGSITMAMLAGGARPESNLLCNPGFNFAQLQTPGTLTTIPDNTYGPDCWKVTRSSNDVQYQRLSNSGVANFTSANRGRFKKITGTGRVVIFQPIENLITAGLINQQVNFQIKVQFNVARNWRLALINWSGTADTLASMITDFTTSPMTLAANYAYLFSYTVASGTGTEVWDIGVGVPASGINNLVVALMVEDVMAVNDTLDIAEGHLNITAQSRDSWYPLPAAEDLARCERFFEKSYDTDVPSATVTAVGCVDGAQVAATTAFPIRYRQRKPKAPSVTLFSTTGASAKWRDPFGSADLAAAAQNIGLAGCGVSVTGGTIGRETIGQYTLDSSL